MLPIGTLLQGRYKIEKVRGEGGFGITYCAMDLKMHARVAIKACVREQEQAARRVQNEATIMGPLRGLDSIVIVVDYFMENCVYYIVMEYIHGTTVKKYIQENGTMKGDEVLERMRPVLQAMEQIHKKGIIHRDISPNNLMITKDHKLKLVDFGEAIKVEQGKEHSVLKDAGYSAMEQSSPQGELGPWTDIYALCATMYFMMTGLTPPEASARWISDTIQPLEIHLGKKQCQAVMKGMALEAKDRYADIHDLRQDLYSEEADRQEEVDFTLTTTTGTDTLMEQYKEQVGGSKKRGSGRNTDASKQSSGRKKKKHRALWITGGCVVIIVSFVLILAGLASMGSDSGSSGVVSSSDLMQAKEQSRIAAAIQENKLDNILNEIDELYPPDSNLSDDDKQNRFVLLLNYYMKKGDIVKEKDLLDSVVTTGESAKYDRVFQDMIKEEQKKLATATAVPTAKQKNKSIRTF